MNESRPEVGSSQNSIDGFVYYKIPNKLQIDLEHVVVTIISEANARRRLSPPDIPLSPLSGSPISESADFDRFNFIDMILRHCINLMNSSLLHP